MWVTHISGLLAGDSHCQWAAWLKTHYSYDKTDDDNGRDVMTRWVATHDDLLKSRQASLEEDGWVVTVENQNKFKVQGKRASVNGKPDIVAFRDNAALISDPKGGKRKDKFIWQVRLYMVLLPMVDERFDPIAPKDIFGELVYPDGIETVTLEPEDHDRIVQQIRQTANGKEPRQVPSEDECRFCDIKDCDVRVGEALKGDACGLF